MAKVNKPIRLTKANTRKYASTRKSGSTLPKPSSRMKPESKLSTTTYKKILSETEFLKVKKRSMMVNGIDLISIDAAANELRFQCNSVTTPGKKYTVILQFNPLSPDLIVNKRTNLNKLLLDSGIKVFCQCSSWLYYGFQYIAVKKGYAAFGSWKVSYPKIRNPKLRGYSCFAAGTLVLTSTGYVPIEKIQVGDLVFTHKGRLRPVVDTMSREVASVSELTYGRVKIRCTDDHRFFCTKRVFNKQRNAAQYSDVFALPIGELGKYHRLVRKHLELDHTESVDSDLAWFLGLYLSDGSLALKSVKGHSDHMVMDGLSCHGVRIAYDDRYRSVYEEMLSLHGIATVSWSVRPGTHSGAFEVRDRRFVDFCVLHGGFNRKGTDHTKFIDPACLSWSKDAQDALVAGFFLGDGSVLTEAGGVDNRVTTLKWFNTNKQMMDMLFILLSQDYYPRLAGYDRAPFHVCGNAELSYPLTSYHLTLSSTDAKAWVEAHPLECSVKHTYHTKGVDFSPKKVYDTPDGYRPLAVSKFERDVASNVMVYNLTVAEDESYMLENLVVTHNCKHVRAICMALPFWAPSISKFLRKYWSDNMDQVKEVTDAISEAAKRIKIDL